MFKLKMALGAVILSFCCALPAIAFEVAPLSSAPVSEGQTTSLWIPTEQNPWPQPTPQLMENGMWKRYALRPLAFNSKADPASHALLSTKSKASSRASSYSSRPSSKAAYTGANTYKSSPTQTKPSLATGSSKTSAPASAPAASSTGGAVSGRGVEPVSYGSITGTGNTATGAVAPSTATTTTGATTSSATTTGTVGSGTAPATNNASQHTPSMDRVMPESTSNTGASNATDAGRSFNTTVVGSSSVSTVSPNPAGIREPRRPGAMAPVVNIRPSI